MQRRHIPWLMAVTRAILGPMMILAQCLAWSGITMAMMVVAALVSDIFDGVLARRWHCDTATVRLCDSMADTVFYLCTAAALWMRVPQFFHHARLPLLTLASLEAARFAFDFAKFGKPASYHSFFAKGWGLILATAVVITFSIGHTGLLLAAIVIGILCDLEGLLMSVIMPLWQKDVKTLAAALRIRRIALAKIAAAAILVCLSLKSFARTVVPAVYADGSASGLQAATTGTIDISSNEVMIFHPNSGAGDIVLPYSNIHALTYTSEVKRHLGFIPALAVGLFLPRQRKHLMTLAYKTTTGAEQIAIFDLPKQEQRMLIPLLTARIPACSARGACTKYTGESTFF